MYAVQIIGPRDAGDTPFLEHAFEGKRTLVQAETRPIAFVRLAEAFSFHGRNISTRHVKLRLVTISWPRCAYRKYGFCWTETVTLVPRREC